MTQKLLALAAGTLALVLLLLWSDTLPWRVALELVAARGVEGAAGWRFELSAVAAALLFGAFALLVASPLRILLKIVLAPFFARAWWRTRGDRRAFKKRRVALERTADAVRDGDLERAQKYAPEAAAGKKEKKGKKGKKQVAKRGEKQVAKQVAKRGAKPVRGEKRRAGKRREAEVSAEVSVSSGSSVASVPPVPSVSSVASVSPEVSPASTPEVSPASPSVGPARRARPSPESLRGRGL